MSNPEEMNGAIEPTAMSEQQLFAEFDQQVDQYASQHRSRGRRLGAVGMATIAGLASGPIIAEVIASTGSTPAMHQEIADPAAPNGAPSANPETAPENVTFTALSECLKGDWKPEQISIGANVNLANFKDNDRSATHSFGYDALKSHDQLVSYLNSDSKGGSKTREFLSKIPEFKNNPQELERALKGEGYFPFQVNVPAVVDGTTYLDGNNILVASHRAIQAGDMFWAYQDTAGNIVANATIRAACNQPGCKSITPVTPKTPKNIPPVTVAPKPPVTTVPPTTETTTPPTTPPTTEKPTTTTTEHKVVTTTTVPRSTTVPPTTRPPQTTTIPNKIPGVPGGHTPDSVEAPQPGPSVPTNRLTPTTAEHTTSTEGTRGSVPPSTEAPTPAPTSVNTTGPHGPSGHNEQDVSYVHKADSNRAELLEIGTALGLGILLPAAVIERRRSAYARNRNDKVVK